MAALSLGEDTILIRSLVSEDLWVEAKPIGDIPSSVSSLVLIMVAIPATVVIPSILARI